MARQVISVFVNLRSKYVGFAWPKHKIFGATYRCSTATLLAADGQGLELEVLLQR